MYKEEELKWTGLFTCDTCKGAGKVTRTDYDGHGSDADDQPCPEECEEGYVALECLLQFDIQPGEPAITSGPPEACDPGSGHEIHKIKVMSPDGTEDWTDICKDIEAASEYAADTWVEPELDPDFDRE